MPWRLLIFFIFLGLVIAFVGINIDNRADISFGFYTFTEVPVYISLSIAFFSGVIVMVPFTFGFLRRKKDKNKTVKLKNGAKGKLPQDAVAVEFSGKKLWKKGADKKASPARDVPAKEEIP